jgi:hypothetical protein
MYVGLVKRARVHIIWYLKARFRMPHKVAPERDLMVSLSNTHLERDLMVSLRKFCLQRRNDRGAISKWRCSRNRLYRSVFRFLVRLKTCLHTCIKEDPERARMVPLSHAYLSKGREDARQRRNDRGAISKLQFWVRRQTRHPKRLRGKLSCHLEIMPIDTKATKVVDSAETTEGATNIIGNADFSRNRNPYAHSRTTPRQQKPTRRYRRSGVINTIGSVFVPVPLRRSRASRAQLHCAVRPQKRTISFYVVATDMLL